MEASNRNGTTIASMCYLDDGRYRAIGSLVYFRNHKAELILHIIPMRAWTAGNEYFIGNFRATEKVPESPYIEGDIMATTDERGKPIHIGHVHTRDNAIGETQYFMSLFGIPVGAWRKLITSSDNGDGRKPLYLQIKLEEDQ